MNSSGASGFVEVFDGTAIPGATKGDRYWEHATSALPLGIDLADSAFSYPLFPAPGDVSKAQEETDAFIRASARTAASESFPFHNGVSSVPRSDDGRRSDGFSNISAKKKKRIAGLQSALRRSDIHCSQKDRRAQDSPFRERSVRRRQGAYVDDWARIIEATAGALECLQPMRASNPLAHYQSVQSHVDFLFQKASPRESDREENSVIRGRLSQLNQQITPAEKIFSGEGRAEHQACGLESASHRYSDTSGFIMHSSSVPSALQSAPPQSGGFSHAASFPPEALSDCAHIPMILSRKRGDVSGNRYCAGDATRTDHFPRKLNQLSVPLNINLACLLTVAAHPCSSSPPLTQYLRLRSEISTSFATTRTNAGTSPKRVFDHSTVFEQASPESPEENSASFSALLIWLRRLCFQYLVVTIVIVTMLGGAAMVFITRLYRHHPVESGAFLSFF